MTPCDVSLAARTLQPIKPHTPCALLGEKATGCTPDVQGAASRHAFCPPKTGRLRQERLSSSPMIV